jgi:hypothetical protein
MGHNWESRRQVVKATLDDKREKESTTALVSAPDARPSTTRSQWLSGALELAGFATIDSRRPRG